MRSHTSSSDISCARDPLEFYSRLRGVSGVSFACQASFDMRLPLGSCKDCARLVGPPVVGYDTEAATRFTYAATSLAWARATVAGPGHAATGSSIYSMQVARMSAKSAASAARLHVPRSALPGSPPPHPAGPRARCARGASGLCRRKGVTASEEVLDVAPSRFIGGHACTAFIW